MTLIYVDMVSLVATLVGFVIVGIILMPRMVAEERRRKAEQAKQAEKRPDA